ncbi:MAG: cell division protein FtsK/SpoIIIE, partial [Proteobacteria bacterium]|nr:cell division protein FtsK/SpoIIIE [Pseudomonadota bacterium]
MRAEMRTSPRLRESGGRLDGPYEPRPANARRSANLKDLDQRQRRAAPSREDRLRQAMLRNIAGASGLMLIASVATLSAALATWSVDDPSWSHIAEGPTRNVMGSAGAVIADLIMQLIGLNAALFLAPVVIWGWQLTIGRIPHVARNRLVGWLIGTLIGAAFMGALPPTTGWPLPTGLGGAIGDLMLQLPAAFNNGVLTDTLRLIVLIVTGPLALAAMIYASGVPGHRIAASAASVDDEDDDEDDGRESRFGALIGVAGHWWLTLRAGLSRRLFRRPAFAYPGEEYDDEDDYEPPVARRAEPTLAARPRPAAPVVDEEDDYKPPVAERRGGRVEPSFSPVERPRATAVEPIVEEEDDPPPFDLDDRLSDYDDTENIAPPQPVTVAPAPRAIEPRPAPLRGPASRIGKPAAQPDKPTARVKAPAPPMQPGKRAKGGTQLSLLDESRFEFPAIELLAEPKGGNGVQYTPDSLEQNAGLLEGVLEDFGIKGEIFNVRPGPVVTLYELEPAPGIKSSRVIGLSDDIARSMSAIAARVAVIPGKNAIGIELPNQRREMVYLRELIASQDFEKFKGRLALGLGKTIGGEPVIIDLARTPHMLVAGTTGSGKSVSINTMILSLLYRMTPEECRLIMIDPKMLELSVYDGIPHLLTPVVTDPRKAIVALKWTVREMEDRYKKMSKVGVRNIEGFNARVAQAIERGESINRTVQTGFDKETGEPIFETEEMELKPLPFIVVIIDEMADLMMVA